MEERNYETGFVLPDYYRFRITRLLLYLTLLYFTLLYFTLLYSTLLYFTLLYFTLLDSTLLYSTLLYFTLLYFTLLYVTLLYSTLLYSTLLDFIQAVHQKVELFTRQCYVGGARQRDNFVEDAQIRAQLRKGLCNPDHQTLACSHLLARQDFISFR